jgi:hypothetical protein
MQIEEIEETVVHQSLSEVPEQACDTHHNSYITIKPKDNNCI